MSNEFNDITQAYWHLVNEIKTKGIKNFTSFYPAMTLNFQQFILKDPRRNWLEATGFKYNIFWTLREFSDRITDDPRTQNPGYAIRFDKARWQSRIEGPKTTEKMLKLKSNYPEHYVAPYDIREGEFSHTYGERWHDKNQLDFVNKKLATRLRWNHIFMSVWNYHEDNHRFGRRVPCTVGIQFIPNDYKHEDIGVRERTLECQAIMRNNLVNSFFISDVFCFTTLFQWMSAKHKFKLGRYSHVMGKVYYRYKVKQQIRIVNSLNDWKEHPFNVYDYWEPQTFGSHKFEKDWQKKEELEEKWRNGEMEFVVEDVEEIEDEYIKNWTRVMAIGEMTLTKSRDLKRIEIMMGLLKDISNEWQYPTAKELAIYIQKIGIKDLDVKRGLISEVFNVIPEGARIDLGKEIIFRSKALKDIVEGLVPGSYERFHAVYRNKEIPISEFRGDEKAVLLYHKHVKGEEETEDNDED